ncbi:MAG: hypothetical protein JWO78_1643 [Micavibrio sp.]|nr:hypothetical protein [Micavibrio sp.]
MAGPELYQDDIRDEAVQRLEYINLIIMTAASDPSSLPYRMAHPESDQRLFSQHLGSLACLMQVHLQDMAKTLLGSETGYGRIDDYKSLIADTERRVIAGGNARAIIHQHIRNLFAFDVPFRNDANGGVGTYFESQVSSYHLAVTWLMDTLARLDCGQTLPQILGTAQNSEVCTKLCFARTINSMQMWQRDLRLIMPGTASTM